MYVLMDPFPNRFIRSHTHKRDRQSCWTRRSTIVRHLTFHRAAMSTNRFYIPKVEAEGAEMAYVLCLGQHPRLEQVAA